MSDVGVDLFAGTGGMTEGAVAAGIRVRWAANHWRAAVDTHERNHPNVLHSCQDLRQADWRAVPPHDWLLAAPSCKGHSPARGKERPHHDAERSTAWAVVDCAEAHRPYICVVENVPAFIKWVLYPAWRAAMEALGYCLSPHILDAANYGVPQNRVRVIIIATRSKFPLVLHPRTRTQPAIAPHIQWHAGHWRKIDRTLCAKTRARVRAGRRAFGERFVMPYYSRGSGLAGRSIDRPIGALTTHDRWGIVDGNQMRMFNVDESRAAMGFRLSYQLPEQSRLAKHLLGNAAPPPMIKGVIREVRRRA